MRYLALATDYDGTLADEGRVDAPTTAALERARAAGRRLVLVTGRLLGDLERVFPRLDLFDRVVVENGAVMCRPRERERSVVPLAPAASAPLVTRLRERDVDLSVGRTIVATTARYEDVVRETIRDLGLAHEIALNKGAVMVLPPGISKASGLAAALADLGLSPRDVVAVGDAENDLDLLRLCGCSAAVANALPSVQRASDLIIDAERGAAVRELIDRLLADDLPGPAPWAGLGSPAMDCGVVGTGLAGLECARTLSSLGHTVADRLSR